ncbi:helix-turn-helix transcriptional regulator [Streptomyces violaceus]|uniref:Helix-turn-helix transcriptional regulator n=1 Tax=Streptomyces violaceus TaxID=1936 RepID=A0ABZ1P4C2_STRVL
MERCDRELQAGGLQAGSPQSGGPQAGGLAPGTARLAPQEPAVAGLVAAGATSRQTALELFVSVTTVQYHLTHIYSKLGIRSRSELVARRRETPPQG